MLNRATLICCITALILQRIPGDDCAEIIGGEEVLNHSKPFMALLEGNGICGGALIYPKWVITAAHCIDASKTVRLGVHNRFAKDEKWEIRKVVKKVPHQCFDNITGMNDIMLLKLNKEVKPSKTISFLQMPKSSTDVKAGSTCNVAGWGITNNIKKTGSDVLRAVNVTVIDRMKCNSLDYYNFEPIITKDMLCAGTGSSKNSKRVDACKGDSGGPLLCNGEFRAITSFSHQCGLLKKPGIYTLLSKKYIEWIKKVTKSYL
ncbi:granzyme A-like [Erpetoichthys calabaricus]|uniref:granzyme A-like n=1 Tax=Erpetoichthys calabaricus TaxID=27687 RepID=UPI002234D2D2|nr:granzyme A-like [Erpetoichthys calabaricus]